MTGNGSAPLLEIEGLTVKYGPLFALRNVSLTVAKGEIVTLLGANGAGKTTCLEATMGLVPKAGGRVTFAGHDISKRSTEQIVRRALTLVREGRKIFADLTVAENLRLGAATSDRSVYDGLRDEMLELFPILRERLHGRAGLLSGGEQQQLAIARALMSQPQLLLLDEPSLGLAPMVVAHVFELIARLRADRGVTILLVEQNVDRALEISDRGYVLGTGEVHASGPSSTLASSEIEDIYLGLAAAKG